MSWSPREKTSRSSLGIYRGQPGRAVLQPTEKIPHLTGFNHKCSRSSSVIHAIHPPSFPKKIDHPSFDVAAAAHGLTSHCLVVT